MLVYSANNFMSVKVLDFPVYRQKLQGFVVGLTGSKLFYLKGGTSMATMELPLGGSLRQYIDRSMFSEAYKLACFGEWAILSVCVIVYETKLLFRGFG